MRFSKVLFFILAVIPVALFAASPPPFINYQGVLRDAGNDPLSGIYDMVFRFYDDAVAGNLLMTDSHLASGTGAVTVSNGLFSVILGSGTVVPGTEPNLAGVFKNNMLVYVEAQVELEILTPRIRVIPTGFALNADNLDGLDSSAFAEVDQTETISGYWTFSTDSSSGRIRLGTPDHYSWWLEEGAVYSAIPGDTVSSLHNGNGTTAWVAGTNNTAVQAYIVDYGLTPSLYVASPTQPEHAASKAYVDSMATGNDGDWTISGSDIYRDTGNVGIGTPIPGYTLDVSGDTRIINSSSAAVLSVTNSGTGWGVEGYSTGDTGIYGDGYWGVYGYSAGGYSGVYGDGYGTDVDGVVGTSQTKNGVYGEGVRGVFGYSSTGDVGVYGGGESGIPGIWGYSPDNRGIFGASDSGYGIIGMARTLTLTTPASPSLAAVIGSTDHPDDIGVYGSNPDTTGGAGVMGYGFQGLWGTPTDINNGWGGVFEGDSYTTRDIYAGGTKYSVMETTRNLRALAAIESPGVWFEDFGRAEMTGGRAVVKIEPLFAQTVNLEETYHVFLTPLGECGGLRISRMTPESFVVDELNGGASDLMFDYRIIARKRGSEKQRLKEVPASRFAQFPKFDHDSSQVNSLRIDQFSPVFNARPAARGEAVFPVAETVPPSSGEFLNSRQKDSPIDTRHSESSPRTDEIDPGHSPALTFLSRDQVARGDVMVMDSEGESILAKCGSEADPLVVGVAVNEGEGQGGNLRLTPPGGLSRGVAVTGIVSCRVDASYGPIMKGDLLVTSPTPGHAMRQVHPLPGTVVGKAMENLESGKGMITILLMLR